MDTPYQRHQCRHIFTDGRRCGSPALRNENFCYYHHTTRKPTLTFASDSRRRSAFALSSPEDSSAVQHNIGEVLRRIASNQIDSRRAALLLYGLQIASSNLHRSARAGRDEPDPVDEVVSDPALGTLAPVADLEQAAGRRWSLADHLMHELRRQQAEKGGEASCTDACFAPDPPELDG